MVNSKSTAWKSKSFSQPPSVENQTNKEPNRIKWLILAVITLGVISFVSHLVMGDEEVAPGIIVTPEGDLALSPERQAKLDKELGEIDNAVQYALIVDESGIFPCYSCPSGQITIFLNSGDVWKYGVTRKGENARYPAGNYGAPNLLFVIEFRGTYSECLKMEKTKIYNYPFLPQALARTLILPRPPGNIYDS